jgi:hypothetical protein
MEKRSFAEQLKDLEYRPIPRPPEGPPLVLAVERPKFSQLRRLLKNAKPPTFERDPSGGNLPGRFMLRADPAVQRALREIAHAESRTLASVTNVILGLGLRAYARLAEGKTPEEAVDTVTEEIRG